MTMNKIISALLATAIVFVTVVLVYNALEIQVQDSLINMFFGLIAAELTTMGGIKITKTKHEKKNKKDGE